ncbi:MAG: hypothetical protein LBJ43_00520 [Propionibacteriaceae bacterium]|jgi:hypothetical protein|nr:hypothetical protein [Propionibacteriaceae bacterium]
MDTVANISLDEESVVTLETVPSGGRVPTPADLLSDVEKWKTLSQKHEAQARSNADKAKHYEALLAQLPGNEVETKKVKDENADLAARLALLEKANKAAQFEVSRARVAAAKGVPELLLHGDTLEELEAAADALLVFRDTQQSVHPTTHIQGNQGEPITVKRQVSESELDSMTPEQINTALADGRLTDLLTGKS